MKKYLYGMLLLSVAGLATTTFVSCDEDKDEVVEQKVEPKEEYLGFKYWMSNDLYDITDVTTTGIESLKFNTNLKLNDLAGKVCDMVELKGQQAKDAAFTVKLTLKSNWKEVVSQKETMTIGYCNGITHSATDGIAGFGHEVRSYYFSSMTVDDDLGKQLQAYLDDMGFEYKK